MDEYGEVDLVADEQDSHRVRWFAPERPVEGVTVFVRDDDDGTSSDSGNS